MTCAREDHHDQHAEWHVAGIFRHQWPVETGIHVDAEKQLFLNR